jgi:hypothetical protein
MSKAVGQEIGCSDKWCVLSCDMSVDVYYCSSSFGLFVCAVLLSYPMTFFCRIKLASHPMLTSSDLSDPT